MPLLKEYNGHGQTHGEEKYVVLMGGLHIEKALLNVLGNWLDGSGWVAVMHGCCKCYQRRES